MATIKQQLDGKVVNKAGEVVAWDTLCVEGRTLGLYFSAHWCPPCKAFTPVLAKYYEKLKAENKNFEIVFVSSDRDQAAFDEYYSEMPWLTLKFDCRAEKEELSKLYKVNGIPSFVILNGLSGELITTKGRAKVTGDPEGFPWPPQTVADILYSGSFVRNDGTNVEPAEVKPKIKAIYFSAHWCPPCKAFTPVLVKTYNKLKESGKEFEVIFASSDKSGDEFKSYFGTMPWLAIPHGDSRKEKLSELCDVEGIPTLVILNAEDKKITSDGRSAVGADPEGKDFPWLPKALNVLSENTASVINEQPCLILFTDGKAESVTSAKQKLATTSEKHFNPDQDQQKLFFFYTEEDDDLIDSLRTFAKLTDATPQLLIVDIPSQKVFEHKGEITEAAVAELTTGFLAGSLTGRALR